MVGVVPCGGVGFRGAFWRKMGKILWVLWVMACGVVWRNCGVFMVGWVICLVGGVPMLLVDIVILFGVGRCDKFHESGTPIRWLSC